MIGSLGMVFLMGFLFSFGAQKWKLPGLVGMLAAGIVLGPHCLGWLSSSLLDISGDLRNMALIIILLKAGLSLRLEDLKRAGLPALLMCFVPATFEITGCVLLGPMLLGLSWMEAALLGTVLGAVSPAVVVPRMSRLMDEKQGTAKSIPQMILAGASCDDIYVIVLFSCLMRMMQDGSFQAVDLLQVPVSMATGILAGVVTGILLGAWMKAFFHPNGQGSWVLLILLCLSLGFCLYGAEQWLKPWLPLSGLLGVMAMALWISHTQKPEVTGKAAASFGALWTGAEVLLFVLVGAAVDIRYTLTAGPVAIALIAGSLLFRSVGVWICMMAARLEPKEKLFCILAYLPKATVQAAIGAVPLSLGLACGPVILSTAVLAILITAPVGAFLLDTTYKKLLSSS